MLHHFPSSITAGLSLKVEVNADDFPAPDWTLTAVIRGPSSIDLEAVAAGTGHLFSVTAATTSTWIAGTYAVSVRAVSGDDVLELVPLAQRDQQGQHHAETGEDRSRHEVGREDRRVPTGQVRHGEVQ